MDCMGSVVPNRDVSDLVKALGKTQHKDGIDTYIEDTSKKK